MASTNHHLSKSEVVEEMPLACADEQAAILFFEKQRWGSAPRCAHCESANVYTIKDRTTGERRTDGRWRCRDCGKQYTVRVGNIMEDSPIPLHKWAYAFWSAATAKNGVSALEMSRKIQVSYKSALFLMNRIRWAMRPSGPEPKLSGTIEADETYIGGKPRFKGANKRGRGTRKQPVVAVLERGGNVRTRIIPIVNAETLRAMLRDHVEPSAVVMTDGESGYRGVAEEFKAHQTVDHGAGEYVRGEVTTNTIEGFFSRVKRGMMGTYHAVSRQHLHRYLDHFEFSHDTRKLNDGERVIELIRRADGKRLFYRDPSRRAG
ncbi:MAG: IS1595 family transposase [Phycisphaerales bacterium]